MPITATVAEKIVREIVDRLEDDNFTVYREDTTPERMTPTTDQVVVRTVSNDRLPALDRLANPPVIAYQLTVECSGQVMISESDAEAAEGHATEIAGNIIQAVAVGADWYKMGGESINATIGNVTITQREALFVGNVQFVVTYRVAETNPFTAVG